MTCGEAALQRYFESLPGYTDDVDAMGETADSGFRSAVDKLPGKVVDLHRSVARTVDLNAAAIDRDADSIVLNTINATKVLFLNILELPPPIRI